MVENWPSFSRPLLPPSLLLPLLLFHIQRFHFPSALLRTEIYRSVKPIASGRPALWLVFPTKEGMDRPNFIHLEALEASWSIRVCVCWLKGLRLHCIGSCLFGRPIGQQILNPPLLRKTGEIGRSHVSPAAGDGAHGEEHLAHSNFVKSRNVTREGRK